MPPAVYLNPLTDFGFKKLFGEEPHKDLLISFLNTLLPEHHQIADLQYTKNEYQGITPTDRKAIFDLNCISDRGERFIVELQKVKQHFFKDRSVYYSTFAIQEQAQRGDWDYRLSAVYTIGILDFLMDDAATEVLYYAQLKDQRNQVFYDKLTFIYLVLPRFTLQRRELKTLQDKWLYAFKHLHELETIPAELQESVFQRMFDIAQLSQFSVEERTAYEDSLKHYRDLKNATDTAHSEGVEEGFGLGLEKGKELGKQEGLEEGELLGRMKTAQAMLAKGMAVALVAELTGLSVEQVQTLA
ncbi:Rpn family recombination-promoting nuclease/putative transposase [Thiofilum flexile]|uniref:Rpn family recombination-promoting nuclease/putative transposase n=1 Tax=Thiofilum flexile TaxID=125627 RepID=UPI00036E1320|nr:Rpn family recombination-promoting nuclease/putative transposase [Thiofilum flexile]